MGFGLTLNSPGRKSTSSISKARSYAEIGEYWDQHELSDAWGKTKKVKFEVVAEPEATYYPVDKDLSAKIQAVAKKQGVSSDTLVNRWLEQKVDKATVVSTRKKINGKERLRIGWATHLIIKRVRPG